MKALIFLSVFFLYEAHARAPLVADVTYYAEPDGIGDCLTPATACSPQAAWAGIRDGLDLRCHRVTVQLAEGTYAAIWLIGPLTGACSIDAVTFLGNTAHPDRVSFVGGPSGRGNGITISEGAWLRLDGVEMGSTVIDPTYSGGHGLQVWDGGRVLLGTVAFRDCTQAHLDVAGAAQVHAERSSIYLTGLAPIFALAEDHAQLWLNGAMVSSLTGYQAFSNGMFHTSRGALIDLSGTILNPMGGPLFGYIAIAESNSVIVLLGIRYPQTMAGQQRNYGGQIVP